MNGQDTIQTDKSEQQQQNHLGCVESKLEQNMRGSTYNVVLCWISINVTSLTVSRVGNSKCLLRNQEEIYLIDYGCS